MGSGAWSPNTFHARAVDRQRAGKDTFDYSADAIRSGRLKVHQTLDPLGMNARESRDSAEHPTSNAIIIGLDVTGSMGRVVRAIHRDLPHLHELLLGHKYIADPQICFAAVGDATCDAVPLQVGQFESDNRMDQHLENMILEGGGGGQKRESYELLLYLAAQRTITDCWDKRREKGFLFLIGDELAYPNVRGADVRRLFGGGIQTDVPLADIAAQAMEKYHVYFIIPGGAQHGSDREVLKFWKSLVGAERVIELENADDTSECIALAIGAQRGIIGLEQGVAHLKKRGVLGTVVDRISRAVAVLFGSNATVHASPDSGRTL